MACLLNAEEEDEFYSNVYGGFNDVEDDVDYESESSTADSVDSDFVDTEDDNDNEVVFGGGVLGGSDDESKKRRTRRVVTKSYKEPKKSKKESTKKKSKSGESSTAVKPEKIEKSKSTPSEQQPAITEGRRLRASTVKASETAAAASAMGKRSLSSSSLGGSSDQPSTASASSTSAATLLRKKALLAEIAQRKNVSEVRRLTQAELLAEAKITEEINKRSLARYQRLEIERKKIRVHKQVSQQPMIRVHSFTVPSIDDQPEVYGAAVNTHTGKLEMRQMLVDRDAKCSRTLISFTDDASFASTFPSAVAKQQQESSSAHPPPAALSRHGPRKRTRFCPITGRVARYLDPLTRTPYSDLAAFRALRYLYQIHLETGQPAIDLLRQYRSGELRVLET